MANLFADGAIWADQDGAVPPASWNAAESRFEVLESDPFGSAYFKLICPNPAAEGDTITFDYDVSYFHGSSDGYINVCRDNVVVHSVNLGSDGASEGSVEVFLDAGQYYSVVVSSAPDSYNQGYFYDFQAVLTPPSEEWNDEHNCDCSDGTEGNETLLDLRNRLMSMLGYGSQINNPPPGMKDLLNNFLDGAQKKLYARLNLSGWSRFYSWPLQAGVFLYDFPANVDGCPRKLNRYKVTWVGVEINGIYRPLVQGINPLLYSHAVIAQWPTRFEFRQCIEIWPRPNDTLGRLIIKGAFGLEVFAADTDRTTVPSELVFLQALADAKAHYRKPDSSLVQQQAEVMLRNMIAGDHTTARYHPGNRVPSDAGYVLDWPVATPPFTP